MTPDEVFALFRRVFGGRDDACAVHFRSPDGERGHRRLCSAVSRSCLENLFPDCGGCRSSAPVPLSPELLAAHLDGRLPLGIYPADKKGLCRFSVIEAEGPDRRRTLGLLSALCGTFGLTCLRELGPELARLWVFYGEPVPVRLAAENAALLMSGAAVAAGGLPSDIIGRPLPVAGSGFGRPVMLPLFGGGSAFVDEDFMPLDGLTALESLDPGPFTVAELPVRPPKSLEAELCGEVYIKTAGLSASELAALCRPARISEPRLSPESGPELSAFIWCFGCSNGLLRLPGGLVGSLRALVPELKLTDSRPRPEPLALPPAGSLDGRIKAAAGALLGLDRAIICAPVGAGKTGLMFGVMDRLRCSTLILATERGSALRWHRRLIEFFGLDAGAAALIVDGSGRPNGGLDVALLGEQTELWLAEYLSRYGLVILADVDRLRCGPEVFRSVMESVCARHVYAVSTRDINSTRWGELVKLYCGEPLRM